MAKCSELQLQPAEKQYKKKTTFLKIYLTTEFLYFLFYKPIIAKLIYLNPFALKKFFHICVILLVNQFFNHSFLFIQLLEFSVF